MTKTQTVNALVLVAVLIMAVAAIAHVVTVAEGVLWVGVALVLGMLAKS
jgi:hypothetical protein